MGGGHRTKVDRGLCWRPGCDNPIYANQQCSAHYQDERRRERLAAVGQGQPTHPDQLPVKPYKVLWKADGRWQAYIPLVEARHGQPCREHPEDFYPEDGDGPGANVPKVRRARASCAGCPDRVPCLEFGIAHSIEHGVWGGTTPDERRAMLRARGQVSVELHTSWLSDILLPYKKKKDDVA